MNIKKRLTVAFAVVTLLSVFAEKISAGEKWDALNSVFYQTINIYYYDLSKGEDVFAAQPIDVYGSFTNEQTAFIIYSNLFEHYSTDRLPFISEETKLLSAKIKDSHLIINVSQQIKDYGGGTAFEQALVNTIVKNAEQIGGIKTVSLLIDGIPEYLPEGTGIFEMNIHSDQLF